MNEVTKFQFENNDVRTISDENGEIWFVGKDVCLALGIAWKGSGSLGPLDNDEVRTIDIHTIGGIQNFLAINEPGLYSIIFRSSKQEAKRFKRWVTHEVLPTIRKTGAYTMDRSTAIMAENYEFTRNQLRKANAEKKLLQDELISVTPYWAKIKQCKDMELSNAETSRVIGKSQRFVSSTLKKMAALGIKPDRVSFRLIRLESELRLARRDKESLKRLFPEQFKQIEQARWSDLEGGAI